MAIKLWLGNDVGNEGDWSVAANFSPAGVPVNTDDVDMKDSSQSVTAGFDQSAVTLASLNIFQSYTGLIGDDSNYLAIGATALNIGQHYGPGTPAGSGRIKINLGAAASTVTIYNAGNTVDNYKPAIRLLCNHADTDIRVRKGTVGIAFETAETSTFDELTVSYVSRVQSDAKVYVGSGVTLATISQSGGDVIEQCAATTITTRAGTLMTVGSGAIATLNVKGGTVTPNSTGTIAACNIAEGGTADFSKSAAPRTITTLKLEAGGKLKYDPNILTITNKVDSDNPVTLTAA